MENRGRQGNKKVRRLFPSGFQQSVNNDIVATTICQRRAIVMKTYVFLTNAIIFLEVALTEKKIKLTLTNFFQPYSSKMIFPSFNQTKIHICQRPSPSFSKCSKFCPYHFNIKTIQISIKVRVYCCCNVEKTISSYIYTAPYQSKKIIR